MSDQHEADHTDPGLDREVGQGYPEEQPGGAGGEPAREDEPDRDRDPDTATDRSGA